MAGASGLSVVADPADARVLHAAGPGGIPRSDDAGATWRRLPLDADGGAPAYLAISARDPRVLSVATYEAGIYRTADAGASWVQVKAPSK